jgi:hypothetical protein
MVFALGNHPRCKVQNTCASLHNIGLSMFVADSHSQFEPVIDGFLSGEN